MSVTVKRCPICKSTKFHVPVTVSQTWLVDSTNNLVNAITTCDSVEKRPTDNDVWTCAKCGHSSIGINFNLTDKPIETKTLLAKWFDTDLNEHIVPIQVELFEKDVVPMAAITAAVKTWLDTPEGHLHNDDKNTVTFDDLHKIPEAIFRQHEIRVTVQKRVETIVSYDKNLKEGPTT